MKPTTRIPPAVATEFLARPVRGAVELIAVGTGAVAAFGILNDASDVWLWGSVIVGFVAFLGGVATWAVRASHQWTPFAEHTVARSAPQRPELPSPDTITYWFAAVIALGINVLATAGLVSAMSVVYYVTPYLQTVAVLNLAGYVVTIGALRTGQIKDN